MGVLEQNKAWIDEFWGKFDSKMRATLPRCEGKIPYSTENGVYDDYSSDDRITWWTNGFFGGLLWLMYKATGYEPYKEMAEDNVLMMDRALKKFDELHHDVGFMWHILSGADYRITGNEASRTRSLYAAATLFARYNPGAGYIKAWNLGEEGWTIIDTMMNIPLLYWAAKELNDDRYAKVAIKHSEMAMRDHVRPDGSVAHIVNHDTTTGEALNTDGGQGYAEGSSWSRGASWALYGFALSYAHSKREEFLETAKKVAHYFVFSIIDDDFVPRCDFRSPAEPLYYDTTAGAVAACGLIEIAKHVSEFEKEAYLSAAIKILKGLEKFCDFDHSRDSILQEGRERYHDCFQRHIIYGDFYLAEALYKLRGEDMLFW